MELALQTLNRGLKSGDMGYACCPSMRKGHLQIQLDRRPSILENTYVQS